jgi:hypothetical protein
MDKFKTLERLNNFELAKAIKQNPNLVTIIPEARFASIHVTRAAFNASPNNLAYVPREYWTDAMKTKVFISPFLHHLIHEDLLTPEFTKSLIAHDVASIRHIPHHLQSLEVANMAVQSDIMFLNYINPDLFSGLVRIALEPSLNKGGHFSIKQVYRDKVPQALVKYNSILQHTILSPTNRALCLVYKHRLNDIGRSRLKEMSIRLKTFDAYRALTSTEMALQIIDGDVNKKRKWLEQDFHY